MFINTSKFIQNEILPPPRLFLALILLALNFACQKNDTDEFYCCDPEINQWVIENKETLIKMNRSEFVKLDREKQKAAFNSFSADKKLSLWKEKFESHLLNLDQSNSSDKKLYIKVLNELSLDLFSPKSDLSERKQFIDNLIKASEQIGWSKEKMVITFMFLELPTELRHKQIQTNNTRGPAPIASGQTCHCSWDLSCISVNQGDCEERKDDCEKTGSGCGWFFLYPCTGRCEFSA